ncbi:MAG: VWA domain-containing protein [Acidobacteria bacterium]|nr:VWA domain-containing protein [Acidobacteriota bacterium]
MVNPLPKAVLALLNSARTPAGTFLAMYLTGLAVIVAFTELPTAGQQPGTPPRVQNGFDVILKQGGIMDYNTLDELDRRGERQVETRSEATLSRLDLKAPGRARSEYNKALHLLARKDFQNAVNRLTRAISFYPEFVAAHNALGCAYFDLKQNELARDEFTRAVQLDDHLSGSFLNLGRADLALGQTRAAQVALEKAWSIAPLDSNLPLLLGYVQFLNRDYAASIRTAQQVHQRGHSGTALVHYFAAASWQAQNESQKTRIELETFLAEDPTSGFAQPARDILQQIKSQQDALAAASHSAPVSRRRMDNNPSLLGQKVLQDINQKKEIAEAEAEAEAESSVENGNNAPGTAGHNESRHGAKNWTFRTTTEEVAVYFTATDHGKSVTNLRLEDVSIEDNDKPPLAILSFLNESKLPLRMGLLIDTSMSVSGRFSFEQSAAIDFLRRMLTGNNDRAFAAGFSNSVVLVQDFTEDLDHMARGIKQLVPIGGTALWDAVSYGADKLAAGEGTKAVARVLVVVTDGDDNSSTATLKQAIERAERDEVIVYAVSTRDFDPANDNDLPGNHALRLLAERTGGSAFFPGSLHHLSQSLAELQEVIRSRYLIGYKPAAFDHDGNYRAIAIMAKKSGRKLTINCRKGYYTSTNSASRAHL